MKDIYTTRTGVKIGLAYEPPRRTILSADMERLQTALLRDRPSPLPHLSLNRAIDILCWVLAVVLMIGVVVLGGHAFA